MMCEYGIIDKCDNVVVEWMCPFLWLLSKVRKNFIPVVPKVLFILNGHLDGI